MFRKLFVIVLGLALLGGFAVAEAGGKKGKLILRVDTHEFTDFDQTSSGIFQGGAAFYVSGDICEELALLGPCTPIGKFHCWGWLIGPTQAVGLVSQEFDIDGRGKIQVQGIEDDGPRAVVGGTGDFRDVRGEATGFDFSQFASGPGEFIVDFDLKGAKGKKK
jgi:hypothetical protein